MVIVQRSTFINRVRVRDAHDVHMHVLIQNANVSVHVLKKKYINQKRIKGK